MMLFCHIKTPVHFLSTESQQTVFVRFSYQLRGPLGSVNNATYSGCTVQQRFQHLGSGFSKGLGDGAH